MAARRGAEAMALHRPADLHHGRSPPPLDRPQIRHARPERWGDVVLQRKGTPTSYHLSVVVDDAAQGVTHVTRGRDMEPATDIHVLLQMLLGLPSPVYTLPQADPRRRAARSSANRKARQRCASLREAGWTPRGRPARQLGFD